MKETVRSVKTFFSIARKGRGIPNLYTRIPWHSRPAVSSEPVPYRRWPTDSCALLVFGVFAESVDCRGFLLWQTQTVKVTRANYVCSNDCDTSRWIGHPAAPSDR